MVPLLVLLFSAVSESANILMLHPIYCGSHEFVLRQMGDQLVSHGHEVTQVCTFIFLMPTEKNRKLRNLKSFLDKI